MSSSPRRNTNMLSYDNDDLYYESDSSNLSVYSDADLDDLGYNDLELFGDRFPEDEIPPQTDAEILAAKIQEDESIMMERAQRMKLQHPDDMDLILPARELPSVQEMNQEWFSILDAEIKTQTYLWAIPIIENWWKVVLNKKRTLASKLASAKLENERRFQLHYWKKIHSSGSIRKLGPLIPFEDEFSRMLMMKRFHNLLIAGLEERDRLANLAALIEAIFS